MSFLSRAFSPEVERRAIAGLGIPPWSEVSAHGGYTGPQDAMRIAAFFACVKLLANSVSMLPVKVYRKQGDERVPVNSSWLMQSPYPGITWHNWKWMAMQSLAVTGNAFCYVTSRDTNGRPLALLPVHPDSVSVNENDGDWTNPAYEINGKRVPSADVFHVKAYPTAGRPISLSPVELAASDLELAGAADRYGLRWFKDSANPSGILSTDQPLDPTQQKQAAKSWILAHNNRRIPAVLGDGLKWQPVSITPEESQFLQCVVAGTLFTMADGTRVPVEQLRVGDMVQAWNGSKIEAAAVAAVGTPPVKELVRIKTARGRELTATADHPALGLKRLRTPGRRPLSSYDGEWIPMGELEPGNYVRVALGSLPAMSDGMSGDAAYFLGAMVGDGYIRSGSLTWSSVEDSVTARMSNVVASLGGELKYKDRCDYNVQTGGVGKGGSEIRTLLNESGLIGKHSHTKFVPDSVIHGGPTAWRQFLSGYFDADGSIRPDDGRQTPAAYWSSTSMELLNGCQHLLALLGIQSAIYSMGRGGRKDIRGRMCDTKPSWGLYVMGTSQLSLLANELDLAHAVKSERLAVYKNAAPSRYSAVNFDYDRVVEVERLGEGETVGIEIERLHTHVTNGIITHNTRAYQKSDIAMLFGIPPHMIGDTEKTSSWGQGVEQMSIGFVVYTLSPWLICLEEAFNQILPNKQFVKFNADALLRGDHKSRNEAHALAWQNGWINSNEIRATEDLPPIPNGDQYMQPMNFIKYGTPPSEYPGAKNSQPASGEEGN